MTMMAPSSISAPLLLDDQNQSPTMNAFSSLSIEAQGAQDCNPTLQPHPNRPKSTSSLETLAREERPQGEPCCRASAISNKDGIVALQEKKPEFPESFPPPKITPYTKALTWFTPYRQLFLFIFTLNLIGAIIELSNHWPWATHHIPAIVIFNILVGIAIRNEWVLRFLYWVVVKIFRPWIFPLQWRAQVVGILYHIGGVHSGCGVSALLWHAIAAYHHLRKAHLYHTSVLATLIISLVCLLLTCCSAFPVFRGPHHNVFEMTHRFIGWLGILFTVAFLIVDSLWDFSSRRWDAKASRVLSLPELWFMLAIIDLIGLSWITTTKVPVQIFTASNKASVIRFPGGLTSGLHTRVSLGGLREWHIFGSISEGKNAKYHYVVAAVQGEFTSMLNVEKPAYLYTKLWKPCGLPYFSRLFTKGVAICTGSGIGAVGSTCIQHDNWFLIWIGPDLEKTYGKEIMNLICDRIPAERRLIWDTRGPLGRPDVVQLLRSTHQSWEAEVTLFIGSPALNSTVLTSCAALKIPAFGSIWDA